MRRILWIVGILVGFGGLASAQSMSTSPDARTGHQPSGSYFVADIDSVANYNGNVMLDIPLFSLPGRELSQGLRLTYNAQKWEAAGPVAGVTRGIYHGGWKIAEPFGTLAFDDRLDGCNESQTEGYWTSGAAWWDSDGGRHFFANAYVTGVCDENSPPDVDLYSTDGTGIHLGASSTQRVLIFKNGTFIDFSPTLTGQPAQYHTANGNFLMSGMADSPQQDTLGRTIAYCTNLSVTCGGTPPNGTTYLKRYTITDANGSPATYTLNYRYFRSVIDPWYNGSGSAASALADSLDSIDLPNGDHYIFTYDHYQGFLTKVTLPTGASIQFVYANCSNSGTCTDTNPAHDFLYRRIVSEGGTEKTWQYDRDTSDPARVVTMTNPDATTLEHTFNSSGLEAVTRWAPSGVNELQKVNTTWMTSGSTTLPFPVEIVTTAGPLQRTTSLTYDSEFRVVQKDDSDWYGAGGAVTSLSRTINTYQPSTYLHLLGTVEVQKCNSTCSVTETQGKTQYFYDESTPMWTSSTVPNSGTGFTERGNITTIWHYKDASTYVTETFAYNDLGNVIEHHDPMGNLTTIIYTDNFSDASHNGSTYAYPTGVTNAKSQTASLKYEFFTGVVTQATDVRGQITTSSYSSPFNRPYVITEPGGRETTYTYSESAHTVIQDVLVASGKKRTSEVFTDGLLRPIEVVETDPGAGDVHTTTHYDVNGRVDQISQPFRTGATPVYTTSTYDALGRPLTISNSDGITSVGFSYYGNTVTATDEAGIQRRQTTNGLDQLIVVEEPNPTLSSPLTTSYSYKVTGALTGVNQYASTQTRTFTTNWLGELTGDDHPETGATTYSYDDAGNVTRRHDARAIDTDYTYDVLNRLLTTNYSDGTPTVTNTYDQTSNAGLLTYVTVGSPSAPLSAYAYAYTDAGLLSSETRGFSAVSDTFTSSYTYDYDGRLLNVTYPSGRVVAQTYVTSGDAAMDRIDMIKDNTVSGTPTILSSVVANAAGQMTSRTLGSGTVVAQSYNNRNQLTNITASQSGGSLLNLDYGYGDESAPNVGRIRSRTDNVQQEHSVNYVYDSMYRLREANGVNSAWSVHWALDSFGNRTGQTASGMASGLGSPIFGISSSTNRMNDPGISYDGAGNMTNDGALSYTFDGEDRLATAFSSAVQYEYDGAGRRLKTTVGGVTTYSIYGITGLQSEFTTDSSIGATAAASTDRLQYRVPEQNGTGVLVMSAAGIALENNRVFPFGEPWRLTDASTNAQKFTSYDRDATTNLDYAMARDYTSHFGRFMSPDPGHVGANVEDPQSWNAYTYILDDPLNGIDPTGLGPKCPPGGDSNTGSCLDVVGKDPGGFVGLLAFGGCSTISDAGSFLGRLCSRLTGSFDAPNDVSDGGGGGGGGGGVTGNAPLKAVLQKVGTMICSGIPNGRTVGVNGTLGLIIGPTGSVEKIMNYDSGSVSYFISAGFQGGWNGGAQGNATGGLIYGNLGRSNQNYSGPFTALSGTVGLWGLAGQKGNGIVVRSGSFGASLFSGLAPISVGYSKTVTSKPLQGGNVGTDGSTLDMLFYLARQMCNH